VATEKPLRKTQVRSVGLKTRHINRLSLRVFNPTDRTCVLCKGFSVTTVSPAEVARDDRQPRRVANGKEEERLTQEEKNSIFTGFRFDLESSRIR